MHVESERVSIVPHKGAGVNALPKANPVTRDHEAKINGGGVGLGKTRACEVIAQPGDLQSL